MSDLGKNGQACGFYCENKFKWNGESLSTTTTLQIFKL